MKKKKKAAAAIVLISAAFRTRAWQRANRWCPNHPRGSRVEAEVRFVTRKYCRPCVAILDGSARRVAEK